MSTWVSIDSTISSIETARVPVTDAGFLYGDSVFETFRTYGGEPHALRRHLDRLDRSASAVEIELPSREQIVGDLRELLSKGKGDRRVRLMVTRGDVDKMGGTASGRCVILSSELVPHPATFYSSGTAAILHEGRRGQASVKAGSYLASVLATRAARKAGAHEALFCTEEEVLEGATSNLFIVTQGKLLTPALGAGEDAVALGGITRSIVLELGEELVKSRALTSVKEAKVSREMLRTADEAFITSATREVMPLSRIGERSLPVGPSTKLLLESYRATLPERCGWF